VQDLIHRRPRRRGDRHGATEQLALSHHAAHLDEQIALLLGLDALGNDLETGARRDVISRPRRAPRTPAARSCAARPRQPRAGSPPRSAGRCPRRAAPMPGPTRREPPGPRHRCRTRSGRARTRPGSSPWRRLAGRRR
jgi:hypothetical protein